MNGRENSILFVANEFEPCKGGIAHYSADVVQLLARDHEVSLLLRGRHSREMPNGLEDHVSIVDVRECSREEQNSRILDLARTHRHVMFNQTTQNDPQMLWQLKRTGARSYLFVYGADIGFIRRPRGWIMHYLSFLMAQRVITISRSSEERLQQKFPFVKTDIVMPGIRQEPQHGEPLSERRGIVSVGRLVERKGHDTLLRAVRRLKDQGIDGNTTIIGEGPERTHLVQLVKQLGLDSEVTFMRGVDDEGVREALRKHRVFCQLPRVLPNGDVEGFGIVFLEAASQGLPVVAGASGGVPDAVSDGVGGYLVNPTDIDDVAEHLQTLLSDDICWQEMSAGAVAWAERFWWDSRRVQDEFPFLRMGR